jgi:hypothetical protein
VSRCSFGARFAFVERRLLPFAISLLDIGLFLNQIHPRPLVFCVCLTALL